MLLATRFKKLGVVLGVDWDVYVKGLSPTWVGVGASVTVNGLPGVAGLVSAVGPVVNMGFSGNVYSTVGSGISYALSNVNAHGLNFTASIVCSFVNGGLVNQQLYSAEVGSNSSLGLHYVAGNWVLRWSVMQGGSMQVFNSSVLPLSLFDGLPHLVQMRAVGYPWGCVFNVYVDGVAYIVDVAIGGGVGVDTSKLMTVGNGVARWGGFIGTVAWWGGVSLSDVALAGQVVKFNQMLGK